MAHGDSRNACAIVAIPLSFFKQLGLPELAPPGPDGMHSTHRTAGYVTRMPVVWEGGAARLLPIPIRPQRGSMSCVQLLPGFHKDISTGGDSMLVLAAGIGALVLCALLLLDSETTLLMLFLIGIGYLLALGYIALIFYLFARMLRRRDAWLLYFLCMSVIFIAFLTWLLSAGIIGHQDLSKLFMFGGIPYSILSIVFGIAMLRATSSSKQTHHDNC